MHLDVTRRALGAIGLALAFAAPPASAQDAPVRVRATIEKIDGQTLTVKARDGSLLTVKLADDAKVVALVKASVTDIKPGGYIGVTALPQTDGSWRAVEVHILMETMRGVGEGDRPWDLLPKSTMTNGGVAEAVKQVDGHTVTLKYKDGEKKILVVSETAIVTYLPGDKADLKVGAKIFIPAATKLADGTLTTVRVNVGRDGVTPPM